MRGRSTTAAALLAGALAGCASKDETGPAQEPPLSTPVLGAGIAADGNRVVVTAPNHDTVVFVRAGTRRVEVQGLTSLAPGSMPNRIAIDGDDVYVVLRGTGALAHLDGQTGRLVEMVPVCPEPRGLYVDEASIRVACAGGDLVKLDRTLVETDRWFVDRDLREVVGGADGVWVSRHLSAEVLWLDEPAHRIRARLSPEVPDHRVPRVGTRLIRDDDTSVILLHQSASVAALPIDEPLPEGGEANPPPYGSFGCGSHGPVQAHASWFNSQLLDIQLTHTLHGVVLPIDLHEGRLADAARSGVWHAGSLNDLPFDACIEAPPPVPRSEGPTTAVLWTDHHYVEVSEAPFEIRVDHQLLELGPDGPGALPTDAAVRTFHLDTGAGIACASCHPEGQQDGHTWVFSGLGPRRTQSIAGDSMDRTPFHWDGSLPDLDALLEEVHQVRMGGEPLSPNAVDELATWMDGLRPVHHAPVAGDLDAGEISFQELGCPECHSGPAWTDNQLAYVGTGGLLKTPSLLGVGARGPWMHDGCAETLMQRFTDPQCGGDAHGQTSHLDDSQLLDLVAFLETL